MSERKFDVFASLQAEARRIGQEGLAALTSLSGGALGVINTARSLGFRKGIPFLLAIAMGLSACGGGVTPTAESPTREPEIPTVPSEASPIISEQPAGFGLTPGPEANPTPSPDLAEISGEIYVVPTKADEQNYRRAEATPPESIKDEVARYKAEMEKVKASVAQECAVDPAKLKTVFKEGSVGNEYRWTVVYETTDGQTCWAINAATGRLGQYPTYFDAASGRVRSIQDGISWERVDGSMDWFGTVPGLIRPGQYVVPEGMTGLQLSDQANWNTLEVGVAGETGVEIKSPFAEADMNTLNQAGYVWNGANGTLERNGQFVLGYDGRSWVDEAGVESSIESLKINLTDGVDFEGKPIVAVLTRTVEDQTQLYNPEFEGWQVAIDVAAARSVTEVSDFVPTFDNWGTYDTFKFDDLVKITLDDIESGRLFYSEQLALKEWAEGVQEPVLQYAKWNSPNYWSITQYPHLGSEYEAFVSGPVVGEPTVWSNDPIRTLAGYALEGEDTVIHSMQYRFNGQTVILKVKYEGRYSDLADSEFSEVQQALSDPQWLIVEPSVHDDTNITPLLPVELQRRMEELSKLPPMKADEAGFFPVGDEIFAMQRFVTENRPTLTGRSLQIYLRDKNDRVFRGVYLEEE